MTRDEAVARIQQGLGFRDDIPDQIVGALKEAKRLLEMGRSLPNFLLQESQTLAVPAGTADVPLPTGFIREWQEESPWYVATSGANDVTWLEKLDFNIGKSRFARMSRGRPIAYTLRNNGIKFWPDRDIAYSLTWSYYKKSVDLSTNVANNEWLDETLSVPECLIGRAGMIVAADLEDNVSLQKFSSMYKTAWDSITNEDQLNDEENRPLAVGARL